MIGVTITHTVVVDHFSYALAFLFLIIGTGIGSIIGLITGNHAGKFIPASALVCGLIVGILWWTGVAL